MRGSRPLALARPFRYIPPTVAKVYIVTFRSHDDRWPSKFMANKRGGAAIYKPVHLTNWGSKRLAAALLLLDC